jgi:hypothetical protein
LGAGFHRRIFYIIRLRLRGKNITLSGFLKFRGSFFTIMSPLRGETKVERAEIKLCQSFEL